MFEYVNCEQENTSTLLPAFYDRILFKISVLHILFYINGNFYCSFEIDFLFFLSFALVGDLVIQSITKMIHVSCYNDQESITTINQESIHTVFMFHIRLNGQMSDYQLWMLTSRYLQGSFLRGSSVYYLILLHQIFSYPPSLGQ